MGDYSPIADNESADTLNDSASLILGFGTIQSAFQ